MLFDKLLTAVVLAATTRLVTTLAVPGPNSLIFDIDEHTTDLVTWDNTSLYVRGRRQLFYSGEFHPFRLPVPGLWLDVFQKIRALGYTGVSFYVDWALLEGTQGTFRANGIFALDAFFSAATQTGIYLLARPGPYINAEVAGGGFPGWLVRNPAHLRTDAQGYLNATDLYMSKIGAIIAAQQITNGGQVILVQPENEYSYGTYWPEADYFNYVIQQLRSAGIVVPLISNDVGPYGDNAPGSAAPVDIYGHDSYPLGFNCANPSSWPDNALPTDFTTLHNQQSPSTPYSIVEFQGGSFDPWGGVGFDMCTDLLNQEFQRVFYKNDFSFGVKIVNYYMIFGGTNWGNLGHPGGYSSYDYGAAIDETRGVSREKYSGAKLLANGLKASVDYLTATAQNNSNGIGAYTNNNNIFVTALIADQAKFFVVRHSNYTSTGTDTYTITFPTSQDNITVPQLGGSLSLIGRDSKMHFTDFDIGGVSVLYSTADLFTWKQYDSQHDSQRVLVVYSGANETNELAITNSGSGTLISGPAATIQTVNNSVVINWSTNATRRIVQLSNNTFVHIVDRNTAYNYWVINEGSVPIVYMKSGYLMRSIDINGDTAEIVGDLNQTTSIEVWGAGSAATISFNGQSLTTSKDPVTDALVACVTYNAPTISVPDLQSVGWKVIDGLPEIQSNFNDDNWPQATLTYTNNTSRGPISTAENLYAGDYGYHTGSLVYRGNFTSDGTETTFQISPQGGFAFAYSLWIDNTFLGSYTGNSSDYYYYGSFNLPQLTSGQSYIFTVLIDHMGYNENGAAGADYMKEPRGIMQYILGNNRPTNVITWKLTGNLGGENYADLDRGPLNEGGMWAERQGYHLPDAPISGWEDSNGPTDGLTTAGVRFYSTTFDLNFTMGYDIPLSVDLNGSLSSSSNYRVQIFVNGYQFGKFISNIGPQTVYPVPEGIWNYQGSNTLAISLWALDAAGAKVGSIKLTTGTPIQSGYGPVSPAPQPAWTQRDAY